MSVEERLELLDFSQFSKVKEILRLKLKLRRRADLQELSMDELDYVTAAGTIPPKKPNENPAN